MVPKDLLLLVFITLCSLLPYWIRAGPRDQSGGDRCDLIKLGHGDFCLISWISCSEGSQLPCCEDTQSVLWRGLYREEPSSLANSRPVMSEPCNWASVEVDSPAPIKPSIDCSSICLQLPSQNCLSSRSWIPDQKKLWKTINVYSCIKPLSFGVICYTAIKNWCNVISEFPTPWIPSLHYHWCLR